MVDSRDSTVFHTFRTTRRILWVGGGKRLRTGMEISRNSFETPFCEYRFSPPPPEKSLPTFECVDPFETTLLRFRVKRLRWQHCGRGRRDGPQRVRHGAHQPRSRPGGGPFFSEKATTFSPDLRRFKTPLSRSLPHTRCD